MGWVTLDDGQKVFIGSHGEFMPRGPGSARGERHARLGSKMAPEKVGTVRERAAAMIRAKRAKEGKGKPAPQSETEKQYYEKTRAEFIAERTTPSNKAAATRATKNLESLKADLARAQKEQTQQSHAVSTGEGRIQQQIDAERQAINAKVYRLKEQVKAAENALGRSTSVGYLHEAGLKMALKEGKTIPAHVLKDYPEIAAGIKAAPAPAPAAGAVKSGPQALRDYYAAKSKGGAELTRAKQELLRTKLDQERRQVAATEAASKPAAGMVGKPAIPARSERPNYAKPVVAYKARQMQSDISTARKELAAEMTGQRIRDTAKAAAAARVQAYNASLSPQAAREAKFSLLQRSATGTSAAPVNTGRGTTKFMFDMNKKDLKGQTSMFDRPEAKPAASRPAAVAPARPAKSPEAVESQRQRILSTIEERRRMQMRRAGRADIGPAPLSQHGMSVGQINTDRVYARKQIANLSRREQAILARRGK